jgi:1-deoxy-D-xylulose-5-phosphate synthase
LGVPDTFIEHGSQMELYKECGFDTDSIYRTIKAMIGHRLLSKAV